MRYRIIAAVPLLLAAAEADAQLAPREQAPACWIRLDDDVRAAGVGSGTVPVSETAGVVELLATQVTRTAPAAADLVIDWDRTTVRIPLVLTARPAPAGAGARRWSVGACAVARLDDRALSGALRAPGCRADEPLVAELAALLRGEDAGRATRRAS